MALADPRGVPGTGEEEDPYAQQQQTFAQMQQGGYPRPASPQYASPYGPAIAGPIGDPVLGASGPQYDPNKGPVGDPVTSNENGASPPRPTPVAYDPSGERTGASGPSGASPVQGGGTNFEDDLRRRYEAATGGAQQFGGNTQRQNTPTFVPGANPFQSPQGGSVVAPYSSNVGPVNAGQNPSRAPRPYNPQGFSGATGPLADRLQSLVGDTLQNPSAYNSDVVQNTYNRLSGQIDDQFTLQDRALETEMARRGLSASSIYGGNLRDLNVSKRSAKTDLADQLLNQQALTYGQDRASAIGAGQAQTGQTYNQGLSTAGFNQNAGQLGYQNAANTATLQNTFNNDAFQGRLQAGSFNQGLDQSAFANALARANQQNSVQQNNFSNQLQAGQFNQGLSQDQFNNSLTSANYGAAEDQRAFGNAANTFGINQGANQQAFTQEQARLAALLGYGQQGFQNQQATAQVNADEAYRQRLLLLQQAGLGTK